MHPEAPTEREAKILARLIPLLALQLDCIEGRVKPESRFVEDLGADSLGLVECILAVEEAFEIDIPDEETEKLVTVGDAVRYIAGAPAARVPS